LGNDFLDKPRVGGASVQPKIENQRKQASILQLTTE
jgi:hypothetical protein